MIGLLALYNVIVILSGNPGYIYIYIGNMEFIKWYIFLEIYFSYYQILERFGE